MTTINHTGLAATQRGRTDQITRGYLGQADELKHKQTVNADCDQPRTLAEALRVITHLQNKLTDAQTLIDDMRAIANVDATIPGSSTPTKYWDSKRVARESGLAVCTICRNAADLGGIKLGGDWLFPEGTTYGHKRKRKSKVK